MTDQQPSTSGNERRLADSPWLWLGAFSLAGVVALVVIAPKHIARQERLERMAEARSRLRYGEVAPANEVEATAEAAAERATGPTPDEAASADDGAAPAAAVIVGVLLALSVASLGVMGYLRSVSRRKDQDAARIHS